MNSTPKIPLVAGATGMIGGQLLDILLDAPDYPRVYAATRRPLGREHPKLANRVVTFPRMAEQLKGLAVTDAYCCIGTTIKDAGSQEAFRDVDLEAVLQFAQASRALGASRFVVVSSVGADPQSTRFYLRVKGEMEEAVTAVGFPSLDILQPGLLLGPRRQVRPLELLGRVLSPVINPLLTGKREIYRAIGANVVARAMLGASRRGGRGIYRHTYTAINQLAALRAPQPVAVQTPRK